MPVPKADVPQPCTSLCPCVGKLQLQSEHIPWSPRCAPTALDPAGTASPSGTSLQQLWLGRACVSSFVPVDDNQIAYRAFVAKGNDLLVGRRVIPALGGVSGGELDNHKTWVRPLAFQTCELSPRTMNFPPKGETVGGTAGRYCAKPASSLIVSAAITYALGMAVTPIVVLLRPPAQWLWAAGRVRRPRLPARCNRPVVPPA